MIYNLKGDLLKSDCTIIAHQANCFKNMGSGIAKQIKKEYPLASIMDKQLPFSPEERLGQLSFAYIEERPLIIYNLYGQYFYGKGRHTDYQALSSSLHMMMQHIHSLPVHVKDRLQVIKIGLPYRIGCGLGGGRWNKVKDILEFISSKHKEDIYLYSLD